MAFAWALLPLLWCGQAGDLPASYEGVDLSCNAAGVARSGFRDRAAVAWMNEENAKRAPYYIKMAKRLYEKGLRQQKGIDKSNNDPFIALYDGQHQVLGALDLAPRNASVWRGAGEATAMIASLSEEGPRLKKKALTMFARACQLDGESKKKILEWTSRRGKKEDATLTEMKKSIAKSIGSWGDDVSSKATIGDFMGFLRDREVADVCRNGAEMDSTDESGENLKGSGDRVAAAIASMTVRPLFPTLITTVNVGRFFGKQFSQTLGDMAIAKYTAFNKQMRQKGQTDANDINDAFFSRQATGDGQHRDPRAVKFWPELYKSKEYEQLLQFMRAALLEHAAKTGYALTAEEASRATLNSWAAVYLQDGGRHGYHVHQGSVSSCVFYAKAPAGKTPIMFIDPRGAPPTHDYEQHLGERDFEPTAPFHHNYNHFAQAGDLICFPSWLVHRVPSHYEEDPRVAFPANLMVDGWDAWYKSATLA